MNQRVQTYDPRTGYVAVINDSLRFLPLVFYVATIVLANWAIGVFGVVPVGFGLMAPAGVWFAGLSFSARNLVQQSLGRRYGFGAIILGAGISYAISPGASIPGGVLPISVASGLTFLLSETVDALVWTRLRQRGWWARAMVAGDVAGQIVDSAVFLLLAFGSLEFLAGQVIGKWWTILPVLALMVLWKRYRSLPINPVLRKVEV